MSKPALLPATARQQNASLISTLLSCVAAEATSLTERRTTQRTRKAIQVSPKKAIHGQKNRLRKRYNTTYHIQICQNVKE